MAIEAIEEEPTKVPTLIRTFGEYWNPDLVNWAKILESARHRKQEQ